MIRYSSLLPSLAALLLTTVVRAETASAPGAEVSYDGIDAAQASAIAQTLSAARTIYAEDFGLDMPDQVVCDVRCATGNPTRLYTDGNSRVFLSLPDKSKLDRPQKSGVFNLYGMCHELGHIAMYRTLKDRDWMSGAAAEGWAHFAGSVVVDRVYEIKGPELWPDGYDYRTDGTARLDASLKRPSPSNVDRAADQWRKLEAIVGRKGLMGAFKAWQSATLEPGKERDGLLAAIVSADPAQKDTLGAWWKSAAPLLVETRPVSSVKAETIDRRKLLGQPVKIEADDGTSDGKRSIAGGGHARKFETPGDGKWYVVAVSIYGSRYGPARAPATKFDMSLCDEQINLIQTWQHPYSAFPHGGDGQWVRFEVIPTRLPAGRFSICLNFRPTATNGVYAHWDSSTHGDSHVATPGKVISALEQGDWMIRVELDRAADADPLK